VVRLCTQKVLLVWFYRISQSTVSGARSQWHFMCDYVSRSEQLRPVSRATASQFPAPLIFVKSKLAWRHPSIAPPNGRCHFFFNYRTRYSVSYHFH
ncbi:hypothetical protein R3P38DRAFT_2936960, partial [Favolaschia claudopus]